MLAAAGSVVRRQPAAWAAAAAAPHWRCGGPQRRRGCSHQQPPQEQQQQLQPPPLSPLAAVAGGAWAAPGAYHRRGARGVHSSCVTGGAGLPAGGGSSSSSSSSTARRVQAGSPSNATRVLTAVVSAPSMYAREGAMAVLSALDRFLSRRTPRLLKLVLKAVTQVSSAVFFTPQELLLGAIILVRMLSGSRTRPPELAAVEAGWRLRPTALAAAAGGVATPPYGVPETDMAELLRLKRYLQHSLAAYAASDAELVEALAARPADVLASRWVADADTLLPAFYVLVDHGLEAVVVCIRGTMSMAETLVNFTVAPEELGGGTAHRGMTLVARELLDHLSARVDLARAFAAYPHYSLHLVGHSMGGAVAALLAVMLKVRYPHAHAYVISPPSCMSRTLAASCAPYVNSYVNGDDVVARFHYDAIYRLKDALASLNVQGEVLRALHLDAVVSPAAVSRVLTPLSAALDHAAAGWARVRLAADWLAVPLRAWATMAGAFAGHVRDVSEAVVVGQAAYLTSVRARLGAVDLSDLVARAARRPRVAHAAAHPAPGAHTPASYAAGVISDAYEVAAEEDAHNAYTATQAGFLHADAAPHVTHALPDLEFAPPRHGGVDWEAVGAAAATETLTRVYHLGPSPSLLYSATSMRAPSGGTGGGGTHSHGAAPAAATPAAPPPPPIRLAAVAPLPPAERPFIPADPYGSLDEEDAADAEAEFSAEDVALLEFSSFLSGGGAAPPTTVVGTVGEYDHLPSGTIATQASGFDSPGALAGQPFTGDSTVHPHTLPPPPTLTQPPTSAHGAAEPAAHATHAGDASAAAAAAAAAAEATRSLGRALQYYPPGTLWYMAYPPGYTRLATRINAPRPSAAPVAPVETRGRPDGRTTATERLRAEVSATGNMEGYDDPMAAEVSGHASVTLRAMEAALAEEEAEGDGGDGDGDDDDAGDVHAFRRHLTHRRGRWARIARDDLGAHHAHSDHAAGADAPPEVPVPAGWTTVTNYHGPVLLKLCADPDRAVAAAAALASVGGAPGACGGGAAPVEDTDCDPYEGERPWPTTALAVHVPAPPPDTLRAGSAHLAGPAAPAAVDSPAAATVAAAADGGGAPAASDAAEPMSTDLLYHDSEVPLAPADTSRYFGHVIMSEYMFTDHLVSAFELELDAWMAHLTRGAREAAILRGDVARGGSRSYAATVLAAEAARRAKKGGKDSGAPEWHAAHTDIDSAFGAAPAFPNESELDSSASRGPHMFPRGPLR